MTYTINYYELVLSTYHDTPQVRIRYSAGNEAFESALYTPSEANNILTLWRMNELCGSFGIGHTLAADATFQLVGA